MAALIVLITGHITPLQAVNSVDFNIIFYLLGVFIIGSALEQSNYLEQVMLHLFKWAHTGSQLLAILILFSGFSTMLLMNDTIAIVGAPAILLLCKKTNISPLPLLLALAYTLTLSSVTSPIANPQNLLIANQINTPFVHFFHSLLLPTLLNGVILFIYLRLCFHQQLSTIQRIEEPHLNVDKNLAKLAKLAVIILFLFICVQITLSLFNPEWHIAFSIIALVSASPIILKHRQRLSLIQSIDWHTLLFFISLFIFIESVWLTNYFQTFFTNLNLQLTHPLTITGVSLLLSQLISNVPLVILYLPFLQNGPVDSYMILAMASTMAGNLFILGAASNIIIIQNVEKRGEKAFTFAQFSLFGIPLCLLQVAVYLLFIS
nr:SLC13 family permease [Legionella tunisiensis]